MLIDFVVSLLLLVGVPASAPPPALGDVSLAIGAAEETELPEEQNTGDLGGRIDPDGISALPDASGSDVLGQPNTDG